MAINKEKKLARNFHNDRRRWHITLLQNVLKHRLILKNYTKS